jgi:lantibiotic modifying enzyme
VLDIVGGSSGTILGLLDCYSDTGDKVLLKAAEAFGEHLLGKRVLFEGRKLWRSVSATQPLAGFGHGMSGFAYALLRLSDVTGREDFYASACEALDYEKSVFSPEHKNWPDFRKNKEQTGIEFMGGWCSGAPGIGLARLAALPFLDNQQIRTDIENALEYVLSTGMESEKNDHLCCGHASGIDFLIEAAVQLNRPELFGSVREYVSRMITRAQKKGRFSLNTDIHGPSFSPGFFSGTSGIGYIILRTVVRGELPSLLY